MSQRDFGSVRHGSALRVLVTATLMQDQFRGTALSVCDEGDLRIHYLTPFGPPNPAIRSHGFPSGSWSRYGKMPLESTSYRVWRFTWVGEIRKLRCVHIRVEPEFQVQSHAHLGLKMRGRA